MIYNPKRLLTYIFKVFSLIDRYSSGERIAYELNDATYSHVFDLILQAIGALEGDALREFEEMSTTLWKNALHLANTTLYVCLQFHACSS